VVLENTEVLTSVGVGMSLDGPLLGLCRNSSGTQIADPIKEIKTICISLLNVILTFIYLRYFIFWFYFLLF